METGTIILVLSCGLPVLIVAFILYRLRGSFKKQTRHADRIRTRKEHAFPANAKILSIKQGISGGDINRIVHLELEIMPLGGQTYKARTTWFVDTLHFSKIQEENIIPVKIDPKNPHLIFPDISWATYTEGYENR